MRSIVMAVAADATKGRSFIEYRKVRVIISCGELCLASAKAVRIVKDEFPKSKSYIGAEVSNCNCSGSETPGLCEYSPEVALLDSVLTLRLPYRFDETPCVKECEVLLM